MNVLMLDHDPRQAARWHCDAHLGPAVFAAIKLLGGAWHERDNAAFDALAFAEGDDRETPWIERVILPRLTGQEQPPVVRRSLCPSESRDSFWTLYGQRILNEADLWNVPQLKWVAELGGNYDWLWRLGMALDDEHRFRFGKAAPLSKILWTLEPAPYALRDTLDSWTEVALSVPEHLRVTVDGYYDSVASCRRFVALAEHSKHQWTGRESPPWLHDFEETIIT